MAFLISSSSLYRVLGKVIVNCYHCNLEEVNKSSDMEFLRNVFQMEELLGDWARSLPSDLSLLSVEEVLSIEPESIRGKLRTILSLRYHNVRVLLHRPVVVQYLAKWTSGPVTNSDIMLSNPLRQHSVNACILSAAEIIQLVREIIFSPVSRRAMLGAWWFTLYYSEQVLFYGCNGLTNQIAFNAALVIFSALMIVRDTSRERPLLSFKDAELTALLKSAIDSLELLDPGNALVQKSTAYLERLSLILSSGRFPKAAP